MEAARLTTRRSLLLFSCALVLAGCQPKPVDVYFTGTADNVLISSSGGEPWSLIRDATSIAGVTVWPKDSDFEDRVWQIRSNHCPTDLHEVHYGVNPTGFEQVLAPQPLVDDVIYTVLIESCSGRHDGGGYLQIADGRVGQVWYLVQAR